MGASVPVYVKVIESRVRVQVVYAVTLDEAMEQVREMGVYGWEPVSAAYDVEDL